MSELHVGPDVVVMTLQEIKTLGRPPQGESIVLQRFTHIDVNQHGMVMTRVVGVSQNAPVEICLESVCDAEAEHSKACSPSSVFTDCQHKDGDPNPMAHCTSLETFTDCERSTANSLGAASVFLQSKTRDTSEVIASARDLHLDVEANSHQRDLFLESCITRTFSVVRLIYQSPWTTIAYCFIEALGFWLVFRTLKRPFAYHFAFQLHAAAATMSAIILLNLGISLAGATSSLMGTIYGLLSVVSNVWFVWSLTRVYPMKLWTLFWGTALIQTVSFCMAVGAFSVSAIVILATNMHMWELLWTGFARRFGAAFGV